MLAASGVRSLRWPGGTDVDHFDWRAAVGTAIERGELPVVQEGGLADYQTPALGLHEFLDACEELALEPLLQVNVLASAADNEALIEYILGETTTVEGARRAANGRTMPWPGLRYLELGNEPSFDYVTSSVESGGADYAALAAATATAIEGKASELGVVFLLSGALEATFQLASWLPAVALPEVDMLEAWNSHVLSASAPLRAHLGFAHGHFYAYFGAPAATPRETFERTMTGGPLLAATLQQAIGPLAAGLPIWITEYQVVLKDATDQVIEASTLDVASGLAVGDMLLAMLKQDVRGAHLFNLSQRNVFGMFRRDDDWRERPAGLAFGLLAPLAGERPIDVTAAVTGLAQPMVTIAAGVGNVPDGFAYEKVVVYATRNAATGASRVIVLNKDFASAAHVVLTVPGHVLSAATMHVLTSDEVTSNNEVDPAAVAVVTSSVADASELLIPAHALVRLDFEP